MVRFLPFCFISDERVDGVVPFRSAPAQNALPSPVTIPTRKAGSLSSQDQIASSSTLPAELMQFRERGRESVTRRTCGAGKESLVKEVGGGGVVKEGEVMVEIVRWRLWHWMSAREGSRKKMGVSQHRMSWEHVLGVRQLWAS